MQDFLRRFPQLFPRRPDGAFFSPGTPSAAAPAAPPTGVLPRCMLMDVHSAICRCPVLQGPSRFAAGQPTGAVQGCVLEGAALTALRQVLLMAARRRRRSSASGERSRQEQLCPFSPVFCSLGIFMLTAAPSFCLLHKEFCSWCLVFGLAKGTCCGRGNGVTGQTQQIVQALPVQCEPNSVHIHGS